MSQLNYKESTVARARRVVIKVGSAVLSDVDGLRVDVIEQLAAQIESAVRAGQEIVIVTSGAVAAGRARLSKLQGATIAARQAAAATGQIELMSAWARAFDGHGRSVAQILLTHQDLAERRRRQNATQTITELLGAGVIPIVNENDTVAVEEIRLGDNDVLSSLVASLVQAQLLIILSDVDGVLTGDPRERADARLIPVINDPEAEMRGLVAEKAGPLGSRRDGDQVESGAAGGARGNRRDYRARARSRNRHRRARPGARSGHADRAGRRAAQEPQALDRIRAAAGGIARGRQGRGRRAAQPRTFAAAVGRARGARRFRRRRLREPARSRRRRVRARPGELSGVGCAEGGGPAFD